MLGASGGPPSPPLSFKNASVDRLKIQLIAFFEGSPPPFSFTPPMPGPIAGVGTHPAPGSSITALQSPAIPTGAFFFFPDCCIFRYFHPSHTHPEPPAADNGALIGNWQRLPGFWGARAVLPPRALASPLRFPSAARRER